MISHTRHGLLGVGGGRPAWAGSHLQRIGVHFWNRNTTQMSSIDLGRTLRKLLVAFHTFQHQFSPDGNRNWSTHAAELSPPLWDAVHTTGRCSLRGFHRANAGRYWLPVMQVHLHRVATCPALLPLCCVFSFPQKTSVPELNDQSSYTYTKHMWSFNIFLKLSAQYILALIESFTVFGLLLSWYIGKGQVESVVWAGRSVDLRFSTPVLY
jgi:hypothetical protein